MRVDGKINVAKYLVILEENLLEIAKEVERFIFQ